MKRSTNKYNWKYYLWQMLSNQIFSLIMNMEIDETKKLLGDIHYS